MYGASAQVYDALYSFKNYQAEAIKLKELISQMKQSEGSSLLDVACGTGSHLVHFADEWQCEGVEPSEAMRKIARQKLPFAEIHPGDMRTFQLGKTFDVVFCLFSSIGYMKTETDLRLAAENLVLHLAPGGLLIVEPWLSPEVYVSGKLHANYLDEPDLKLARMVKGEREGRLSIMDMHHLVADAQGVRHFVERHEMGLYAKEEYLSAFEFEGSRAVWHDEGLDSNRGLVLVVKDLDALPERSPLHEAGSMKGGSQGAFDF